MLYSLANLPYWIILGLGVLLFLIAISAGGGDDDIGGDDDFLDLDADTETDIDSGMGFAQFLGWLGIGKVPLILLLATDFCLWGLTGWMLNAIASHFLGFIPVAFLGLGGIIFIVSLGVALQIGGLISRPVGKLFASFGEDASSDRLIGCLGTVSSKTLPPSDSGKIGQVDVSDANKNLVSVGATIPKWATVIPQRGQQVLIIDRREDGFVAIAKDTSDEDRWLTNTENSPNSRNR